MSTAGAGPGGAGSGAGGSGGASGAGAAGRGPDGGAQDGGSDAGLKDGGNGGGSDGSGGADAPRSDAGPPTAECPFASGLNVAWVKFANDVPNPDIGAFNTIFKNTYDAGGRSVRWWFHTNGTVTPGYDASGKALPILPSHIDGVKSILNAASANKVKVIITLWSFDMLQPNAGEAHTNNSLLLENDAHRQAYIDNYLTPLVNAVKDTPGIHSWDIFNEPEGMGPNGWAMYRTTMAAIQRTVNWLVAAIRAADPGALITSSAQTFDYCANVAGKTNYYSDSALLAAGGKANGTLDFYQVHYYAVNGTSNSMFLRPASYWALDKKLVVGEFASIANDGVAAASLYTYLYDNGYAGAWAWAYNSDWPWPSMQVPMQNLYSAHPSELGCSSALEPQALPFPASSARTANHSVPRFSAVAGTAEGESIVIHALAERGASAAARARAEQVVNDYADSEWVREIERFTGAHRHRNVRVNEQGVLESF
jgi:Cellulase (glycosyl hydrolase family 5)